MNGRAARERRGPPRPAEVASGRLPPHDLEAEAAVLGSLLLSREAVDPAAETLAPEDFYRENNGTIYRAALALHRAGEPIDYVTLAAELEKMGVLEKVGGRGHLAGLSEQVPTAANILHYALIVKAKAYKRRLIAAAGQVTALGYDDAVDAEEACDRGTRLMAEVAEGRGGRAPSTWEPQDLLPHLRGTIRAPDPVLLDRADGVWLLYPGKVHWISGEPEGGKTWFVLIAVADVLESGLAAVYVDFEGDAATIVERLQLLGVSFDAIASRLSYHRPEAAMTDLDRALILARCAELGPAVSVIDGVQAAMGLEGADSNIGRDFYQWWGQFGQPLRKATPGPLLCVDHVTKDPNTRGVYAAGTIQKQAAIDVHFGVEVQDPFGIGMTGRMRLMLHKDRAGRLRARQSKDKAIGGLVLASDGEAVSFAIEPPQERAAGGFRPTTLMQRVSEHLEKATEPLSKRRIRGEVPGKEKVLELAVERLHEEGYLLAGTTRGYTVYSSATPYRAPDDDGPDAPEQGQIRSLRRAGQGRHIDWCPVVPTGAPAPVGGGGALVPPVTYTGAPGTTPDSAGGSGWGRGAGGTTPNVIPLFVADPDEATDALTDSDYPADLAEVER